MITNKTFMWGIFNPHLDELIKEGLPYLDIHGQQIFILEDVEKWLKEKYSKKEVEKNETNTVAS